MVLIFGSFRVLYTLMYALGLQPWRTICYSIAQLTSIVMLIWSIVLAFQVANIPVQVRIVMVSWAVFLIMTYSTALFTSVARMKTSTPASPEDSKYYGSPAPLRASSSPKPGPIAKVQSNPNSLVLRFTNCHRNALEFLMLFAMGQFFIFHYMNSVNSPAVMWVLCGLLIFVITLRVCYTLFYFTRFRLQRAFSWGLSLFVMMIVLSWCGVAVLISMGRSL